MIALLTSDGLGITQMRAIRLAAKPHGLSRIDAQDRQVRLHCTGALPQALASVKLPEVVHVQLDAKSGPKAQPSDAKVLVLFVRTQLDQDRSLDLLCRLFGLDLGFLGRGF